MKKIYNTEYLRKEIHVTLTTSTYCQILFNPPPPHPPSSEHFFFTSPIFRFCLSPLFYPAVGSSGGGSIAFKVFYFLFYVSVFDCCREELSHLNIHEGHLVSNIHKMAQNRETMRFNSSSIETDGGFLSEARHLNT